MENDIKCLKCGTSNPSNSNFCLNCGNELVQNDIKCPNCGTNNSLNSNFCLKCGNQLVQNVSNVNNNLSENNNGGVNNQASAGNSSDGNVLGIISLLFICFNYLFAFISSDLPEGLSSLFGLFPLAGIVIMVIGRIQYPNNKLLKVVMWIILFSIVLSVIGFILFCLFCYITCKTWPSGLG